MIPILTESLWFPNPEEASEDGLLAIGGDLSTDRLLLAYRSGVFPWYEEGQPIMWWSPEERMVLYPSNFNLSKSLQKTINKNTFSISYNTHFSEVIKNCATIKREGQGGTWITTEMQDAFIELHKKGHAHSVEVWEEDELVGGIYGIDLAKQKVFCGESMYSKVSDASKVGLYYLTEKLKAKNYKIIDCQIYTAHLERLGATEISRKEFLKYMS